MKETRLDKIKTVHRYLLFGAIVNHPRPFIISRQNNKIRGLGMSYPIFKREFQSLIDNGTLKMIPGKYFAYRKGKSGAKGTRGCMIHVGSTFDRQKILNELNWDKKCSKWFPNTKEKLVYGKFKMKYLWFDDFIGHLNDLNRKHEFSIDGKALNLEMTRLRRSGRDLRIMTNQGFQTTKKEKRKGLKIDKEDICEVDIQNCHLTILRRRLVDMGKPPQVTGFDFEDYRYNRDQIKGAFHICLNSKTRQIAFKAVKKKLKLDEAKARDLLKFVLGYFKEYKSFFFKENWIDLQEAEAKIADEVIGHCLKESIPIIPIFDSFTVKRSDYRKVCEVLDSMELDYSVSN